MPLQLITAPAAEPVTLAQVKAWARVDIGEDDPFITDLIIAARSFAETKLRRSLITQTWRLTLDAFPGPSLVGIPYWQPYSLPSHAVILERPPIQSITSITYLALDGTTKTLTPGTEYIDLTYAGTMRSDDPVRITPPFGRVWPANIMPQIGAVQITYQAGYGDNASNVPADILTWIKLRAATLYENREEVVVGTRIIVAPLPYIDSIIDPYIVELF